MLFWLGTIMLLGAAPTTVAPQPQPGVMVLAQAKDRCMTTFAVRLTRTSATDPEIFQEAMRSCGGLDDRLHAAIAAQLPAAEASTLSARLRAAAEPNFMALLTRIRSDRARAAQAAPRQ